MQIILTSPEMFFNNEQFRDDIASIAHLVDKIVIDEAHCIAFWGGDFRPLYRQLGNLRALLQAPIYATTATLPKECRAEVMNTLLCEEDDTFSVNLGNNRPNIKIIMRLTKGSKKAPLPDFSEIIEEARAGNIRKRMIFIDDCNGTQLLCNAFREELPDHSNSFAFYNSRIGTYTKKVVMDRFIRGEIRVLIATEAAGMVSSESGCFRKERETHGMSWGYLGTQRAAIFATS